MQEINLNGNLTREAARWASRASKGVSLVQGRFRGLRAKVTQDVSILLPLTAHKHYWAGRHTDVRSLRFLAEHLPKNGVAFDVGANIGIYLSALYALVGSDVQLVGFEPIPSTLVLLQKTLSLNAVPARIEAVALSRGEGELRLSAYADGSNNFWIKGDPGEHPSISVRTTSLDLWHQAQSDLMPHAIKIDVEGHELDVLEGAVGVLSRARPALMVECHGAAWNELGVSRERFAELLADLGYRNLRFADGGEVDFVSLQRTAHLLATV